MKGLPRSRSRGAPQLQNCMKIVVKLRAKQITVDGASGVGFGTVVVGDLPQGNILLLGAVGNLKASKVTAAGTLDTFNATVALGSAPTADATLSGAEVDILPATALGAATSGISPTGRITNATQVILDNTDDSLELNLGMTIPDLDISANGQILALDGEIYLSFVVLGDD